MVSVRDGPGRECPVGQLRAQRRSEFQGTMGRGKAAPRGGLTKGLAGLPHEVDTHTYTHHTPNKQLWEWRAGPRSQKPGRPCDPQPAPARGPAERQAGRDPALGSAGASRTLRRADLLADPGSQGGGEEGRHCCGFAAKEGTYLGYLGDG